MIGQILLGSEADRTQTFVRIRESSNYQVFELMDVDCISLVQHNYAGQYLLNVKLNNTHIITAHLFRIIISAHNLL